MRPTWDTTFLSLAQVWALRATCPRLACGCVIVNKDNAVLASGYNGAPRGVAHCIDIGCIKDGERCIRAVHAEQNAVAQAARTGVSLLGAISYTTSRPCRRCTNLLIQAGVRELVWPAGEVADSAESKAAGDWEGFTTLLNMSGTDWRIV